MFSLADTNLNYENEKRKKCCLMERSEGHASYIFDISQDTFF
jgi:hypothetical protein